MGSTRVSYSNWYPTGAPALVGSKIPIDLYLPFHKGQLSHLPVLQIRQMARMFDSPGKDFRSSRLADVGSWQVRLLANINRGKVLKLIHFNLLEDAAPFEIRITNAHYLLCNFAQISCKPCDGRGPRSLSSENPASLEEPLRGDFSSARRDGWIWRKPEIGPMARSVRRITSRANLESTWQLQPLRFMQKC